MTSAFSGGAEARPYVFAESGEGERDRLELLARMLDPMHRRALSLAGMRPGLRCLELGSGTGTIATWMADQVGARGSVLATDINLSFLKDLRHPNLTVRELDVLTGDIPRRSFDVITCRALLHHLSQWEPVVERLAGALKPDGVLVLIEPDAGAAVLGDPEHQRFWSAWCHWGRMEGIDFRLGRKLPRAVQRAGLDLHEVTMEVPFYGGGSSWDELYRSTVRAARPRPAAWTGRDPSAAFENLDRADGQLTCSFGWMAVCGRAAPATEAVPAQ
ncbi:class I SAM-dependent methyltransferase [Streptomyces albipurpureus]|uniref:Methyltransferase domain-containing protein n=1 Tax=Streptomyces albipurpureus TaxID=2897419 RepID=A0ABT0USL4_9ACTN|nr:class I SAM-dependent methyltransferase [Streptomyces sp. CWNU-1]MCM2391594.1 methyltransferase domain-containing protein [Streptomyces sp. CWNU-1]